MIDRSSIETVLASATGVPGVSLAWREPDGPIQTAVFGQVTSGGADLTPDSLFQAGSVSKPVTAVGVLRLVHQGVVDLDADVNDVLKSWKVPPVASWQPVLTLRRLLTHTAGLTVHGFGGYAHDAEVPTVPQLLDGDPPSNSPAVRVVMIPGLTWKYSGGGTTIAQQAIVDATGVPFPELLRELVLEPCGMGRATFEQPLPERLHEHAAIGHLADGRAVEGRWHTYPEMAAAGLWCAPKDLIAFVGAVQDAVAGKSAALLPQELARLLVTPDPVAAGHKMAVGFFLSGGDEADAAADRFGHGGSDHGFLTSLSADISGVRAAAAMAHSLGGSEVVRGAMRAAGAALGWPEPAQEPLDDAGLLGAVGTYRAADGRRFELGIDRRVALTVPGQPPVELESVTTVAWTTKLGATVVFEVENRAVTAINITQAGTTIRAKRET